MARRRGAQRDSCFRLHSRFGLGVSFHAEARQTRRSQKRREYSRQRFLLAGDLAAQPERKVISHGDLDNRSFRRT